MRPEGHRGYIPNGKAEVYPLRLRAETLQCNRLWARTPGSTSGNPRKGFTLKAGKEEFLKVWLLSAEITVRIAAEEEWRLRVTRVRDSLSWDQIWRLSLI